MLDVNPSGLYSLHLITLKLLTAIGNKQVCDILKT